MSLVIVASHSGYGHTRRVADAVVAGAASVPGTRAEAIDVAAMQDGDWARLAKADAIVFGAPTYMGGPSAPFKVFADESSKVWFTQAWKDKIAGGFTCSLNMSGDKLSTLQYLMTLAMQHGMVWVGLGMMPPREPGAPNELNRLGAFIGVMAQAGNVPPELEPPHGDLETGRAYGVRIATMARRHRG